MVKLKFKVLVVIPARGGSKSIPRKNIKLFAGHPLIAYSIAAGQKAKGVNRIIVSTDDEETAEIAVDYGAEVPFFRPAALAQDNVPDLPVFEHALNCLERQDGYRPDIIVHLRPTSPLRPATCVDDAISLLLKNDQADSVRGVVPSAQNPYKMWRLKGKYLVPLLKSKLPEHYNMPRQILPKAYWQTGHIDVIRYETIVKKKSMSGDRILPFMIDPRYSVDIDSPEQWELAEWMLIHHKLKIVSPK